MAITLSYAQSKISVGIQGGRSSLVPETVEVPNQLTTFKARGAGGVNMLIYGRYNFQPNWSMRVGGGIIGYRSAHIHTRGITTRTGFQGVQPQVMTSLDYHLSFGESNFGVIFSAGLNASRAHQYNNRTVSSEEGHPLTAIRILNEDGQMINGGVLGHDVDYIYSEQKVLLHLRPEVTLFKQMGRHKLLASFVYGYAFKDPILTIDFNSISYQGEYHAAKHRFSGSFTSLQLGYELSF
ncbi:hypothetical protein EL17_21415 [Anditalea andensis]|uniref:Outer membrane protein beta-barrel domain-containing protein n=2 Tax=Anditalea andensis TaxID=1048983 RepID=A0A074LD86_9BACT|nr:hypothetical protein EL17_21415 [Anditalea andensis]